MAPSRGNATPGRPVTANDRMKSASSVRLHRSIVVSVVLHLGIFVSRPSLELSTLRSGSTVGPPAMQLVALGGLAPPRPATPLSPAVPVEPGEQAPSGANGLSSNERDQGPGPAGERGAAPPDGWGSRPSDLWRLAALRPRMVNPGARPVPRPRDDGKEESAEVPSDGDEAEGIRIRERVDDLEYQRLTEEEILSLERLSALRPELVLASTSTWLVLRNPDEVATFLRGRLHRLDGSEHNGGSLSVSLWVDERGSVEWAEINQSSGEGRIDETALELFREVVAFRPAREAGMRVPVAAIFWLMW